MRNSSAIGITTEAAVSAALLKAGRKVLMPFGGSQRYDLVIDDNGKFLRVQCKTARRGQNVKSTIVFNNYSVNRQGQNIGYAGQIEAFGVHFPETGDVFLVPIEDCAGKQTALQFGECLSKFTNKVARRQADKYKI